jgi:arabinofuranosyltransferase
MTEPADSDPPPESEPSGEGRESEPPESEPPDDESRDSDAERRDSDPSADQAQSLREWLKGRPLARENHLVLGLVLPALLAAIHMWRVKGHTVDDAFISYRYSQNLANGLGLVYNAGERIEGYTNFSWTVLLAGAVKLGLDPVVTAKLLGALCGLGTIAATYFIANHLRPLSLAPCIATWLLSSTIVFVGYSVFGLETAMFACLLTVGTWVFLREEAMDLSGDIGWKRWVPWSGLLFGAAGLTRPEAPMYLGLLMLFLGGAPLIPRPERFFGDQGRRTQLLFRVFLLAAGAFGAWRSYDKPANIDSYLTPLAVLAACGLLAGLPRALLGVRNLARGGMFIAPVALHLLWRHSYYGRWLPNTLTAKTGDMGAQLAGGTDYVKRFLDHDGALLYLGLFGIGVGYAWRHREVLAIASIALFGFCYVILVGGDWMVLFRFFAPLLPFVYLVVGLAGRFVIEQRSRAAIYGLILFGVVVGAQRSRQINSDIRIALGQEKHFWDTAAGGVAQWFAEQEQARGREAVIGAIAMGDIGQVGYETGYPVLDLLGLVDPVIADLPGGYTTKVGPGFKDRFFNSAPRYAIIISAENDCTHPSVLGSRVLYHDRRFRRAYTLSGRVALDRGFSWCIYEHVDHAKPQP